MTRWVRGLGLLAGTVFVVATSSANQPGSAPPSTWSRGSEWLEKFEEQQRKRARARFKSALLAPILCASLVGSLALLLSCCRRLSRRLFGLPAGGTATDQGELRVTWHGLLTAMGVLGIILMTAMLVAWAVTSLCSAGLERLLS